VDQSFEGILYRLLKLSAQDVNGSKASRLELYTRENYTHFARFMTCIHNELPHLLLVIPQWSFLATELHCRVLEREMAEAVWDLQKEKIKPKLTELLCRMRQGI
jgi:hypothetical protein